MHPVNSGLVSLCKLMSGDSNAFTPSSRKYINLQRFQCLTFLVNPSGFKPETYTLEMCCSIQLSYRSKSHSILSNYKCGGCPQALPQVRNKPISLLEQMVNLGVITAFISHMSSYLISHHFGQTILPLWLLLPRSVKERAVYERIELSSLPWQGSILAVERIDRLRRMFSF